MPYGVPECHTELDAHTFGVDMLERSRLERGE